MIHPFTHAMLGIVRTGIGLSGVLIGVCSQALGATFKTGPEGAPGIPFRWAPALKQAIGTASEFSINPQAPSSPVWFTVAQGVLTEVFYPSVDQAQVGDLQFVVTDGQRFLSEQRRDTVTRVTYKDEGMVVEISGEDREGRYSYQQTIFTDVASPVVRVRTTFRWNNPGFRVFVLFRPAIHNQGSYNMGLATEEGLTATSDRPLEGGPATGPVHAAVVASAPWRALSAGYAGFSDGWQDLSRNFRLTSPWRQAGPGHIGLTGELLVTPGTEFTFEVALGFGPSRAAALTYARTAMLEPFEQGMRKYEQGWRNYLEEISQEKGPKSRFIRESTFARRSAQLIKMHEDKRHRGAIVASLSSPGIPESNRAREGRGGYHLIWPRDLYHSAMGLLAAGDHRTPVSTLKYLVQRQKPDGSWTQNFWLDGTAHWKNIQLDEVAFPILLAWQLQSRGIHKPNGRELEMVRKAAAYLISRGPRTEQDRWEEVAGYVPSTLAAIVSALRAATALTGDKTAAAAADEWQSRIERWTLVNQGPHGQNYYVRASRNGQPGSAEVIELTQGMGQALSSEILDGGFLELVRLGVREANDPRILSTLAVYESPALGIHSGHSYRRYNRDGFGPDNTGGFWPLLAGERGHYAIASGDFERARAQLHTLEQSALESGHLPEQTIAPPSLSGASGPRVGLGVACPLVWAHAEDILLHRSIEEGKVFDKPAHLAEELPEPSPQPR